MVFVSFYHAVIWNSPSLCVYPPCYYLVFTTYFNFLQANENATEAG